MSTKTYVGDIGTVISLRVLDDVALADGLAVSAATTREILVQKPDGTTLIWTGTPDGADSLSYTTDSDDLDAAGTWRFQGRLVFASGTWKGETAKLRVYDAFR
jgi:hypothetical protein